MNRRTLLALSGALTASAVAGCLDESASTDEEPTSTPTETPTETPTDQPPTGEPDGDDEQLAALAAGNAAFALDLHDHLISEESGNLFLSPYSISVALAMTYAGARGETNPRCARPSSSP